MQVGTITIDGRQIGFITQSEGWGDDSFQSSGDVPEHEGGGSYFPSGHPIHHSHASHGHAAHVGDRAHHHTGWQAPVQGDPSLAGSDYLRSQRSRAADELKDPQTRREVAGMLATEGARDPVPVMESLLNRQAYTGKSVRELLHSGFYGPINRGDLPGAMAGLDRDHASAARMNHAIDTALGGSNVLRGATDQGLPTDPNGRWMGGRVERGGNVFNDWGGGPGGHEGARRFREEQQRHVNAEVAAKPFDPETQVP